MSDHATMAMAIGVGIFLAHRKLGLVAIALALFEGFCRVYAGFHYPTDVLGGLALGTAVTLLFTPLAMALLTPLVSAISSSPHGAWLVRSRAAREADRAGGEPLVADEEKRRGAADAPAEENNLAA